MATERSISVGSYGGTQEVGTPVDEIHDDDLTDTGNWDLSVREVQRYRNVEDEFGEIDGPLEIEEDENIQPLDVLFR